jgi:hypothetical protein
MTGVMGAVVAQRELHRLQRAGEMFLQQRAGVSHC